jgi:thymidylate synthase
MANPIDIVWNNQISKVLTYGKDVAPRGQNTKELVNQVFEVNMKYPVLICPQRKLSYRFMAAEALWILSGDNKVETIAPYNKNIKKFSDDGIIFQGAYGPRIVSQLDYVISTLKNDRETRQAVLTIWNPNPKPSKDIPCTISITFQIRDNKLDCFVFMRSSDLFLGIPYDVFTFSMLSHLVCSELDNVTPRTLYLTATSSHLYETDHERSIDCLKYDYESSNAVPKFTKAELFNSLQDIRTTGEGWWL